MNAPHISVPSTDAASVPDTLARILADKAREVAERMEITPQAEIERRAAAAPPEPAAGDAAAMDEAIARGARIDAVLVPKMVQSLGARA